MHSFLVLLLGGEKSHCDRADIVSRAREDYAADMIDEEKRIHKQDEIDRVLAYDRLESHDEENNHGLIATSIAE